MTGEDKGPALPRGLSLDTRVYLRPVTLRSGPEAARVAERDGAWLANGPLAFERCEVIWRSPGGSRRSVEASLAEIGGWNPGPELQGRVQTLLDRIIAPRQPFVDIAFDRPRVMGIVNVTPDSFFDGGGHDDLISAVEHGRRLVSDGADIIDIGGESTRPGAQAVAVDTEAARVRPVIASLRDCGVPLSIDTRNAPVMGAAIRAGATAVNDVSALTHDAHSLGLVGRAGVPVIIMHSQGEPATMQRQAAYDDVLLDVFDYLGERVAACVEAGIPRARIMVDPGIGFGKHFEHNLALLRGLAIFQGLGCPVLLGVSRKSTIGQLGGGVPAETRMPGSLAAGLWAIAQGVQMLRVHDVAETRLAVDCWHALGAVASSPPDTP